jgi:general secretion pathway protein F
MMLLGLVIGLNVLFVILLTCLYALVGRRRWRIFLLVEHLTALARQGMPIHSGLRAIGRDLGGYLGTRVVRAADRIEEGRSLGEAFQAAPRSFPPLLRNMLTLGEKSGNLAGFLEEMRRSYRRIADLPYQSVYLFIYPVLLSLIINVALAGLSAGILPKFRTIFDQMGLRDDRVLIWWPRLMSANEAVLLLCVATVALLMVGGTSIHFGSSWFRFLKGAVDRGILWIPVIGTLLRDGAVQQFGLCTGLFLRSGATLAEALGAAAEVERNSELRGRLERIARGVAEGGRLSRVQKEAGFGGADLHWFIETGEASGLLVDHLLMASAHYETRARLASRVALRSVVPFFVLLNGAIVAGAYALLFIPITQILRRFTEQAGKW